MTDRTRTIHWQDPMQGALAARQMAGMDYLLAMADNLYPLPPLMHTLDFKVDSIGEALVVFSFEPQEFHYNPIGMVHGGVISSILDSAMGCSLHTPLPAGTGYSTLELKVNFLRAVSVKTGRLQATGNVIHLGKTTGVVAATLTDSQGKKYATASSTCLLMRLPGL